MRYWCSIMFKLGLYFQILDLSKIKVLLDLASTKFCDSVLKVLYIVKKCCTKSVYMCRKLFIIRICTKISLYLWLWPRLKLLEWVEHLQSGQRLLHLCILLHWLVIGTVSGLSRWEFIIDRVIIPFIRKPLLAKAP